MTSSPITPRKPTGERAPSPTRLFINQADNQVCLAALHQLEQDRRLASTRAKEERKVEPESPSLRKGKSGCRPKDLGVTKKGEDSEDGESGKLPIRPSNHTGKSIVGGAGKKGKGDGGKTAGDSTGDHRKRVSEREYCSLSCLLGLTKGGHLDLGCPNIADHGKRHLRQLEFLGLVREQLARDRGRVTDCEPLWISGSRGAMFKVTLTSHDYTVIAKGVRHHHVLHLNNEAKVYYHLRSI